VSDHPGLTRRLFLGGALASLTAGFAPRLSAQARPLPFPEEALSDRTFWQNADFIAAWGEPPRREGLSCRIWPGSTRLGDLEPQGISSLWENGRLLSISLIILDAGAWFGFGNRPTDREALEKMIERFRITFDQTAKIAHRYCQQRGGSAQSLQIGGNGRLEHPVEIRAFGTNGSRLTIAEDQLIKLVITPDPESAARLLAPFRDGRKREQRDLFEATVRTTDRGDRLIDTLPVFPQGQRAYCGVSTLAMVMQHAGLRLDTEDYAMAAGIRFGSTEDSEIRETYDDAGDLAEFKFSRSLSFDFDKAIRSIDAGFPVVVHRRWSRKRDYLHSHFTRQWQDDPNLELPEPDLKEEDQWPGDEAPPHASVVNGYHSERGEVIFSESWDETFRNRRMRAEELEATSYLAYYGRL